jgi:hypothetical protein
MVNPSDSHAYLQPLIADNPATPGTFFAASDTETALTAGFRSQDNGAIWMESNPPIPASGPNYFTTSPAPAFDASGALYESYLGVDFSGNSQLVLAVSHDQGATWSSTTSIATASEQPDGNRTAVDTTSGPYRGRIYVAYSANPGANLSSQPLMLASSSDGGATWSKTKIWDSGGDVGAVPVVGPNGEVYVGWDEYCGGVVAGNCVNPSGQLLIAKSTNGGASFGAPVRIASTTIGFGANLSYYSTAGPLGSNCPRTVPPALSLAVDHSGGVHNGTIYATWGDRQTGSFAPDRLHIFASESTDGGAHWLSRNQIDTGNGYDAWEPAIAVDQSTGVVTIVWYDRRGLDPTSTYYRLYNTYYTQSADGGLTYLPAQVAVDDQASSAQVDCAATGDYLGIAAAKGVAHPVWTDTRSGSEQVFTASIDERATAHVPFAGFTAASPITEAYPGGNFVAGDFTGGGHVDLVRWVDNYDRVSVHAGNGEGTFRAPQWTVLTNGFTSWVAGADLNRDGKLDLAFRTNFGAIGTVLGNGDGTFRTPVLFQLPSNFYQAGFMGQPVQPIVADVNGDGIPDLVIPGAIAGQPSNTSRLQILLGNGDGTFRLGPQQPLAGVIISVAAADFDADGTVDLAVGYGQGTSVSSLAILKGDGVGNFASLAGYDAGINPGKIVAADMRHIGRKDLAISSVSATTQNNQLLVFLNSGGTGQSLFQSPAAYPLTSPPLDLVAADFNNDSYPDVAVRAQDWKSNGSAGGDGLTIMVGSATGALTRGASYGALASQSLQAPLVATDFDGDGNLDLLAGPFILLGRGDATFIAARHFAAGSQLQGLSGNKVVTADFNRDGKRDVAVPNNGCCPVSSVSVGLGNGDGTFQAPAGYSIPNSVSNATDLAAGDVNGDGIPDLIILGSDSNASVLLGNGDGTFKTAVNTPVGNYANTARSMALGEFDGDSRADLVVASTSGITLFAGNADGTFTAGQSYPLTGAYPVAVADVNQNGKSDVIVGTSSGVTVFLGNGNGTVTQKGVLPSPISTNAIAVDDFNVDGKPDLLVASAANGTFVFLGNGDGTFRTSNTSTTWGAGPNLALGDFNGDGNPDFASTPDTGGLLRVLLGRGDGTFTASPGYVGGMAAIASGDFNGDAVPDLVTVGSDLIVLLGRPTKTAASATSLAFGGQTIGAAAASQAVTFTNAGTVPISGGIVSLTGVNASDFSKTADSCSGARIRPAASCGVTVIFRPVGAGNRSATLAFLDGTPGSPHPVSLTGTGNGPLAQLSPSPLLFGNRLLGSGATSQGVTLTNSGNAALHVGSLTKSGADPGDFAISNDLCSGTTLNAGGQCTFAVSFAPAATGARSATVSVADDAYGNPHSLAVTGAGTYGGQFTPLSPKRILDTRDGTGGFASRLGPNSTITVAVRGQGGVPANATAAVLNVTVTNTSAASYLTIYPTGVAKPLASNLNWTAGKTVPNLVEVALGTNGAVDVYNAAGYTNVIFDVAGYVTGQNAGPGPAGFYNPLVPSRLLDTRDGTGGWRGKFQAYTVYPVQVAGWGGAPLVGGGSVVLNVTVTNPTAAGYVSVWPNDGSAAPTISNLNFVAGQTVPNRVTVKLGPTGWINIMVAGGNADVIADLAGWFTNAELASGTGSGFTGLTPARILDTRFGVGASQARVCAGQTISVAVAGQAGVPPMTSTSPPPPTGAVLNLTVTNNTAASYLTVWPNGSTQLLASDLNWTAGMTVPNLVVVRLGADGKIAIYNAGGCTDVIADVVGWYG